MHSLIRRAWVDVDLGALLRNATAIATQSRARLLPMVKADAYGLGAVRVARALERLDPWGFGVATIAEGEELRQAGITRPVLVFTPLLVGDFDAALRADLTPTLGAREAIERWQATDRPWHLAVDTGMSRAGIQWNEIEQLRDLLPHRAPQGVFTHFHSAERNDATRVEQERRFAVAVAALPIRPAMIHAENSASVLLSQLLRTFQKLPGGARNGAGLPALTEISRVIVLQPPDAWSEVSVACHAPGAGAAISVYQE